MTHARVLRDRALHACRLMTEAEALLWSRLREGQFGGWNFRRRAPLGPYSADFMSVEARLVVEVNGAEHAVTPEDAARDAWFAAQGFSVRRYASDAVLESIDAILEDLATAHATGTSGPAGALAYERDPAAIYRQSFATVRAEADLERLPESLHPVAIRLIHACGMVDVAEGLAFSDDVAEKGAAALAAGAPILCDCEMVAAGIIRSRLPAENKVIVTLNDPRVQMLATRLKTTRSAAAVILWREHLEGAVVAVGNAPTALFNLLERLDTGWPKPAAILGFPVGFVGAEESKTELALNPRGVPFLSLQGRRGGSAMASAAVNALAGGLE